MLTPMTSTDFTREQWEMAHRTMDVVDSLRQPSRGWTVQDSAKVQQLVSATYKNQGIEVDAAVVDQAIAVATQQLPAISASEANLLQKALEESNQKVAAVAAHDPFTDEDLARRLNDFFNQKICKAQRIPAVLRTYRYWGLPAGILISFLGALFEQFVFSAIGWGIAIGTFAVVGAFGYRHTLPDLLQKRDDSLLLLAQGKFREHAFQSTVNEAIPLVSFHSLDPLKTSDQYIWQKAGEAAQKHPDLFRSWARWLGSDKPIRYCEAAAMIAAGDAIEAARPLKDRNTQSLVEQREIKDQMLASRNT